jgi:phage-related protein
VSLESLRFVGGGGNEVSLTSSENGVLALWGVSGRFMPSFEYDLSNLPGTEGSVVTGLSVRPRRVSVPVRFENTSRSALRAFLRDLSLLLSPDDGDGQLISVDPDGVEYVLYCRYAMGFEGDEKQEDGANALHAMLVFEAADPYWYSGELEISSSIMSTGPDFYKDPWYPFELESSQVVSDLQIFNPGVRTWPIIYLRGPGGPGVTVRNNNTGQQIVLDQTLVEGDELVIDMRPRELTVVLNSVTNVYSSLQVGSEFFPLAHGTTSIAIEMANADVSSSVQINAPIRWWIA